MKYCLAFIGLLIGALLSAETQPAGQPLPNRDIYITYPEVTDPHDPAHYYQKVLYLALEKTRETDGDFTLHYSSHYYSLERSTYMLIKGDKPYIMWGSVTRERERLMQLIPYDLLRGLNNYRVLIIRNNDQEKFSQTANFELFKSLTSGGGDNWTSTKILKAHNIKVSTAPYYESILKMLAAKRFDYISRGLHEATGDLTLAKILSCDLAIEKSILLQYRSPIGYSFFVNKNNLELTNRIDRGLKIAEQDGSLLEAFNSMKMFREATQFMNQERRIFVLENSL